MDAGLGSNQISIEDCFNQATPSEGHHTIVHVAIGHGNQEPDTCNDSHIQGITDVLYMVKDIQTSLKTNLMRSEQSSVADNNLDNYLHNTNIHQNSINENPPNPHPSCPPPPSARRLSNPALQNPLTPEHQQTISKSTSSWMNALIDSSEKEMIGPNLPMEDQLTDDMYDVSSVLTIPTLLYESQSANKRLLIKTRSISKRKSNRYQISPYIVGLVNASTKFCYGPFQIGIALNTYDEKLITYIFDNKLASSEVIVNLGHLRVTHKGFRTLEPSTFVNNETSLPLFSLCHVETSFIFHLLHLIHSVRSDSSSHGGFSSMGAHHTPPPPLYTLHPPNWE
ncbi:hypothetical protein Ddye_028818 [Dipteronia dyeriana]|uniref:Uncharacterized protein n=1 Tax=Dipteronia dyeriana TaxID=168575 RepID=A0AAD9TE34_9ROSI|nr:hypothetical protein Ddye_028818 [Dipteronia dyeriana]